MAVQRANATARVSQFAQLMNQAVDIYFEIRSRNIPWTTTANHRGHPGTCSRSRRRGILHQRRSLEYRLDAAGMAKPSALAALTLGVECPAMKKATCREPTRLRGNHRLAALCRFRNEHVTHAQVVEPPRREFAPSPLQGAICIRAARPAAANLSDVCVRKRRFYFVAERK